MYRTLQAAHNAAVANDIIYVEPSFVNSGSPVSYGDLTCTKTLKIIGNGYDHSVNPTANPTWVQRYSLVGALTIENGANTTIQGLVFDVSKDIIVKAQNVNISRCIFHGMLRLQRPSTTQDASGAIISHNFFHYYYGDMNITGSTVYNSSTCSHTPLQVQNVIFKNNINLKNLYGNGVQSGGSCPSTSPVVIPAASNITYTNNTFYTGGITSCQNCTVHSNIFRSSPVAGILNNCPGTVASYNVCSTNACVNGTNNVNSANDNLLFVNYNYPNVDFTYKLAASSPALGAGLGGVDAGAFGTNDPYRLSGLAPIPQVTSYSKNASSGVYTATTPMTVTISVRGNN